MQKVSRMKIHPILIQQYNGRNSKTKKTCVVSNPLTTYRPNIEMPNLPVTFGSLIANSELLKMGYKVARVENNKVVNDDDSIMISSPDKFLALLESPNIWNKKIVLTSDIDLAGREIKPIGSASRPFKGEFDGNGCKISNFKIDTPEGRNVGLFGKCENAKISNLSIEKAFIRGNQHVGGFAGYANNCEFKDCLFQGYLEGHKNIGGIVGTSNKNLILESGTECNILAEQKNEYNPFDFDNELNPAESLGGLLGSDNGSTIKKSYSNSTLKGIEQIGGLIGYSTNTTVENAVFKGAIIGEIKSGSLFGWAENSNIRNSYALSNKDEFIGFDINNSTSNLYNSIYDLTSDNIYWDSNVWNKSPGRIPRLSVQEKRMTAKDLFLEDVNTDIKTGRISAPYHSNVFRLENKITINLAQPKHYDENNEILEKVKNSTDTKELRHIFGKFAVTLKDENLLGKNATDKYDEIFMALIQNPNMDINKTYEHNRDNLEGSLFYNIWCSPLFILTCMNKANILKAALEREDADFTVGSGYSYNETILNQAFEHHIDDCAYVLLTEPKMRDYIDKNLDNIKSKSLSSFAKLLLECYPDNMPTFDENEQCIVISSKDIDVPKELLEKIHEVQTLEDVVKTYAISSNYTDSAGNNLVNVASTLPEQEEALKILIAAQEIGTNINNWNKKAESPIGHGIYTNKPHFVSRILKGGCSNPYTRINDGIDAMLMFSKMPEENYSVNYMGIARLRGLSINTCDEAGNTPLINAIDLGHKEAVKYLLTSGANPNKCDASLQTPLHHACLNGDEEIINMLLDAYAYPNVKDIQGLLPVDYLPEDIKADMSERFEDQGILYDTSDISDIFTPKYSAVNIDRYDEIYSLDNISQKMFNGENLDAEIIQLTKNIFVNQNAVNLRDSNNNSVLHIAAQSPSQYAKECLKAALEKGVDKNGVNDEQETPLICAVNAYLCASSIEEKINLMQNIKLLLDNEPNVDMVDTNKQSALHKICQSGNLILFNEILKLNPKINQIDVNGNTPFQYIPASANVPLYITAREYLKSNKIIRN